MSLVNELNKARIRAEVEKSVVTLWGNVWLKDDVAVKPNTEGAQEEECDVTSGWKGKGYVEPHPAGADRGGYVLVWERGKEKAFYAQPDGEWSEL